MSRLKQMDIKKIMLTAIAAIAVSFTSAAEEKDYHSFAWGAEINTGIDMGGDDMSTLGIHASLGYRNPWLRFAGVGVGVDMMMSNSSRTMPFYAMVRTSFSRRPKLLFADLRGGVSFNQTPGVPDRANLYLQPGLGMTLAKGNSFSSHLLLAYTYNDMTFYGDGAKTLVIGLNRVTLSIGVTF